MPRKNRAITPKHNPVEEFIVSFWMLFISASAIFLTIVWQIHKNFSIIAGFFDSLNFSNHLILDFIKWNSAIVWGAIAVYVMTLTVWKVRKGIFSESEQMVRVWSGVFVYRVFTMIFLAPFLIYLVGKIFPGCGSWVLLILASQIFLTYPFAVEKPQRDHALDSKYFVIAWVIVFLSLIVASFFIKPFWEVATIIFISSIVLPSSEIMLKRYTQSIENYESIKAVNETNDKFLDKARKWELQRPFDGESLSGNPASLPYVFQSLDNLGYMLIAGAFAFPMIAWIYHANIITAIYVHATLVLCALQLWIASNRFPPRVSIRTENGWIEDMFLLEKSEKKVLVISRKGKHLFNPDGVLEICMPLGTRRNRR